MECAGRAKRRRRFGRSALIADETKRPDFGRPPYREMPKAIPGRARRRRAATWTDEAVRNCHVVRKDVAAISGRSLRLDGVSPYQKRAIFKIAIAFAQRLQISAPCIQMTPMKTRTFALLLSLFFSASLSAADLTVHAAASLSNTMQEIGAAYEKLSDDKLQFNFGASNLLVKQIAEGAPADLFFAADEAKMDDLDKKGLLLSGSRRTLLSNTLVIVVAADAPNVPKSASELIKPEYKKLALAEPHVVPAGIYAQEYLVKAALWDSVKEKIVPTENVRAALAAVESGNVEAGFVYKTDAMISKKVKIAVEISAAEGPKISYPVAVLKSSKTPENAKRFAQFLAGPEARAIFEKAGFIMSN